MDQSGLHRNTDRPGYFRAWLAVPDSMLPAKGAGHRAGKSDAESKELRAVVVNEFTSSDLWRCQGFPESLPPALGESDFHLPASKAYLQSNDTRKNMTDLQETAQWVSGEPLWKKILDSLLSILDDLWTYFFCTCIIFLVVLARIISKLFEMFYSSQFAIFSFSGGNGKLKRTAVIHTTVYCGSLERACLAMGIPCLSVTDSQTNHGYATTTTAGKLVEESTCLFERLLKVPICVESF